MKRSRNASLRHLNSFSVEARASRILELQSDQDLDLLLADFRFDPQSDLILGGGSNILFAGDIKGTVILNRLRGKRLISDTDDTVLLEAHAGENWHELVRWSLEQGLSGIENLSLIPGLAGAAPMQNIGAYGVELADVIESVSVLDLEGGSWHDFGHDDCRFAYRDSRFKSAAARRYLITRIQLRLQRNFVPKLEYPGIGEELHSMGITSPTAMQVSDAIIRIRQRKLPDPAVTGNAGSFFKNPVVSHSTANLLRQDHADIPMYAAGNDTIKLSAAWLIEQCGWKGCSLGGAAVSSQHALVLINKDNATGAELLELADSIRESVKGEFGIELQTEPRIVRAQ